MRKLIEAGIIIKDAKPSLPQGDPVEWPNPQVPDTTVPLFPDEEPIPIVQPDLPILEPVESPELIPA